MARDIIAARLRDTLKDLASARGELAEVYKAEAAAKSEGYLYSQATSDTGKRLDGEARANQFTVEAHGLKADVLILESWCEFYTLLLQYGIDLDLTGCPPYAL